MVTKMQKRRKCYYNESCYYICLSSIRQNYRIGQKTVSNIVRTVNIDSVSLELVQLDLCKNNIHAIETNVVCTGCE